MENQTTFILVFFMITLVGYIQAINSRTTVRIVLSYVFATIILFVSIYATFSFYSNARIEKEKEIAARLRSQMQQDSLQRIQDSLAALSQLAGRETSGFQDSIRRLAQEGDDLVGGILAIAGRLEDDDEDFDALVGRARGIQSRAVSLKNTIAQMRSPGEENKAALQTLAGAADKLVNGAASLVKFFGAENQEDENRYERSFRYNASQARKEFKDAADKLK